MDINSAEVKVVVDLTKPLPSVLELEREDGQILLLRVSYPWLPPLCPLCKEIGHKGSLCPNVAQPEKKVTKNANEKHPSKVQVEKPAVLKQVWQRVSKGKVSGMERTMLLETHVKEASKNQILSIIGPEWTLLSNYEFSELGKIWIIYKAPARARVLHVDLQSLTCEIILEDGTDFIYTAVYAANEEDERKKLWLSLRHLEVTLDLSNKSWMINGDFNEILSPAETSNDNIISSTRGMRLFGDCLADLGLFDLPYSGPKFTWTNKRAAVPIGKKLDRCLVNGCWLMRFPTSHCFFEAPEISDHSPCHIKLSSDPPRFGTRQFKFFNLLTKHPKFMDQVMEAWENVGSLGNSLKDFCFRLKSLKGPLKDLMKENFSNLEQRVLEAHENLKHLQLLALNDPSPANILNENSASEIWSHLSLAEESFFKQKSRLRWLGEGDSNNAFFHRVAAARNAGNAIKLLMKPDGSPTNSLQEVHELAVEHFSGILCTVRGSFCPELPEFLDALIQVTCSSAQQAYLSSSFTGEAIKQCLFKMPLNKTPGPDGFPAEFFKSTWSIIGQDLISGVLQFFHESFMPSALNSTTLVLIPKRPGAVELKDFRPIACLNTVYKIISRLLADRLKSLLPDLILPNQTAFVKGRLLMENVLLASEVMQGYHKDSAKPSITLKVDISKAFDSVRWDFLLSSLQAYGVSLVFLNWIRACVCSPAFTISISGVSTGFFKGKTGLRQGDPQSPILFVLVMNVLSLMLNKAAENGSFKYHPGCEELKLTHLCFADDLLIFLEGSEQSLRGVLDVLKAFERMSGLGVNIEKTSMFCSGLEEDSLNRIQNIFSLNPSSLPIRYLGLPLCSRKLSVKDCDNLLAHIKKKLNSWTHKFLSMAGRLTLISSVIYGIIGFWTSAFILPKQVIRKINGLCSSFLWHGRVDVPTGAKVSWSDICFPKLEGGLGLRQIESWNATCALKLIWMLFFKAGSIWVAWIRAKYLSNSPFWALNENNYAYSWMFRKLLKLRPKVLKFLSINIGNGDSTFFWWDPWTPFGSLYNFLGSEGPTRLGIPLFSTVAEVRNVNGWSLPNARSERQLLLFSFISTITSSDANDTPVWKIDGISYKSFSSKAVWNSIRESKQEVSWAPLVWHKAAIPAHATTTWLFMLNRNPTKDRMASWGYDIELDCLLCGLFQESRNHLFFECAFSAQVWRRITQKLRIPNSPLTWDQTITWLHTATNSTHSKLALLQGWQGAIYELWRERNRRYHDGLSLSPVRVANIVFSTAETKCSAMHQLGLKRGNSILNCWNSSGSLG